MRRDAYRFKHWLIARLYDGVDVLLDGVDHLLAHEDQIEEARTTQELIDEFEQNPCVLERFWIAIQGRQFDVWLPASTERRLRAAIHRMNCDELTSNHPSQPFDLNDENIGTALLTAADFGLDNWEDADGVAYDKMTGYPKEKI